MRFLPSLACGLVAFDAMQMALGYTPQSIFAEKFIWLWWAAVFGWVAVGVFHLVEVRRG